MALPFPNTYHLRKVAESSAKPCFVCYKPSTSVLITPDQADFFYTCLGHLKDTGFASPVGPTPEEKQKELLEKEVERVKAEWEERQKRRKEREKEKEKEEKDKGKDKKEEDKDKDKKDEDKKDGDKSEPPKKDDEPKVNAPNPRIFSLQKKMYEIRVNRYRQQQQAKKNMERLQNPTLFPSVPKGGPV